MQEVALLLNDMLHEKAQPDAMRDIIQSLLRGNTPGHRLQNWNLLAPALKEHFAYELGTDEKALLVGGGAEQAAVHCTRTSRTRACCTFAVACGLS